MFLEDLKTFRKERTGSPNTYLRPRADETAKSAHSGSQSHSSNTSSVIVKISRFQGITAPTAIAWRASKMPGKSGNRIGRVLRQLKSTMPFRPLQS